jgi:hypothetical protein
MPPNGTADLPVGDGEAGQKPDEKDNWREENTRLRQQLAEQKALNSRAVPWVNVAIELQKQQPEVFEKLTRGEPLTKAEQKVVTAAQAAGGDDAPMTRREFAELMQANQNEVVQQINANTAAGKEMEKLHDWATEELPGYDAVHKSPTWNGILNSVLVSIENGTFKVPEKVTDPYKFAVQMTYDILKAQSPDLLKGARKGLSAEDRAAEILAGGRKASSSKVLDQEKDIPDDIQRELDLIATIGEGHGKKFSP